MKLFTFLASLFLFCNCQKYAFTQSYPDLEKFSEYEDFLSNVNGITLYSTKSAPYHSKGGVFPNHVFHNHEVIGSLEITDQETISKILENIKDNIYDQPGGAYTMCFNPRHGLRLESDNEAKDFQICFECSHLYIFNDINSEEYIRIGLKILTDNTYMNSLLDKQNIPREKTNKFN